MTPWLLLAGASLVLASCSASKSSETRGKRDTGAAGLATPSLADAMPVAREDLAACKSEVIPLPPEFAPTLPKGGEVLWFAPGMFDAEAPGYFRYAFRLDFEKPLSITSASLEELLTNYYQGLMAAVAEGKKRTHPAGATVVKVVASDLGDHPRDCRGQGCVSSGQFFEATIETIDEFVTQKPIVLRLLLSATPNTIVASVLPASQWQGGSMIYGQGQGPAEAHLLPLGCTREPPAPVEGDSSDRL